MKITGQQVYQYANPCRLPINTATGYANPNYFPAGKGGNNNPSNNGLDPYTFLGYWRRRFAQDGWDTNGNLNCQNGARPCSYAGLFYPSCYKGGDQGLGWVAPYMWIPVFAQKVSSDSDERNITLPSCAKGGKCTVGNNYYLRRPYKV